MAIRDFLLGIAPPWLSDPTDAGGKFVNTYGLMTDVLIDKINQSVLARCPGLCDPTALPYIGADRLIPRGPGETDQQYAERLSQAFATWQRAGINSGVIRQVLGFLVAIQPRARIVSNTSRWTSVAPGVPPSVPQSYEKGNGNWNWDDAGDPHVGDNPWWRWWMIFYSTATSGASWAGDGGAWGAPGTKWGDRDRSWGLSIPGTTIQALRGIIGLAKRAGSWCRWMIISLDDTLFVPTTPGDDILNPAGGWGRWGHTVNNVYVRARPAAARYCDGWASTGSTRQADFPTY